MALQLITKSAEVKLVQTLSDMRASATGWKAVYFHLSRLLEEYKSEYQIKIAINLIHDLLKNYDGSIFLMADSSIIVLCRGLEQVVLDKLIFQLRYLFIDDPLVYTNTGQENPDFCAIYDLRRDWQAFYDLSSQHMAMYARKQPMAVQPLGDKTIVEKKTVEKVSVETPAPTDKELAEKMGRRKEPKLESQRAERIKSENQSHLSASALALLERDLRHVNLMAVTRRQPVCAVMSDMKARRVFDELYIHIAHLRQILRTEIDFFSNRWLFKYITHILDERMIELIRNNPQRYLEMPISINLNVETLLSTQFAEFDKTIKPETKVAIVIEIPVIDVFADMAAFMLARDEVQKLGYRLCLDGLTIPSFTSINREKLGLDLIKVQWNADMQSDLKSKENQALIEAVNLTGNKRIILCRCDNRSAIEYGHALGISLFQGRYVDELIDPAAKQVN